MAQFHDESASAIPARPTRPLHRLTDALLLAAYSAQVMIFWSVGKEDAFICYRYARNLVRGDGLVYNPGEYVEGISNLLWTLLLALLVRLGVPIDAADNLMALFFAVSAFLVFRWAFVRAFGETWTARLPLFLLVCMTALPAGFGNGLEGPATACSVAVILAGAVATAPWTMTLGAVMLFMLRPEGFAYAGWAFLWLLAATRRDAALRRRAVASAAVAAGAFAALTAFRLAYYGDFLPNTVRAKEAPLSWGVMESGLGYVGTYLWRIGPVLLVLAALGWIWRRWRGVWLFAAGMAALNLLVALRNGGDWMSEFRLVAPFYGLLAFLAAMPACGAGQSRAWAVFAAGTACLAGGLWTVQPNLILRHVPEFRFTAENMWREPVDFAHLFDSHVSLADFQKKDDRVLSEWGGAPGYALDGVPVMEMWGLTDRAIADGRGPGTHLVPGCGRLCWPAAFAKEPTLLLFGHLGISARISSIAEVAGLRDKVNRFLVVQDVPFDKNLSMFNLMLCRADRPVMSKFALHYGAIAPALDYDDPSRYGLPFIMNNDVPAAGSEDAAVRTPWQKAGWTDGEGNSVSSEWLNWDDDQRLSSRFTLHAGTNRFSRDLIDDSPVALLFGRFALFAPHVRVRVSSVDAGGGSTEAAVADCSDSPSPDFILNPLPVSEWHVAKPARMVIELESDTNCTVFLAAHRWNREPFPEVPVRFVADTRLQALPTVELPETADAGAAVERQRAAFANDPKNENNVFLLGAALARSGDWPAAEPLLRRALSANRSAWPAGSVVCAEEAERRHKNGDPKSAADLLRMVRLLEPENLGHALRLAEMLTELGQLDAALEQCREVLSTAHESPRTAALLDHICEQRNDAQGRVAQWRGLAERYPESAVIALHLGLAIAAAGDDKAAEAQYRRGLDIDPKNGKTMIALAELMGRRGNCDQVAALCREAVTADSTLAGEAARCLQETGLLCGRGGNAAAAVAMLREACGMDSGNLGLFVSLGSLLEKTGDDSAALEAYCHVVDAAPESPLSAARMDAILELQGGAPKRLAAWRGMVERHPSARVPRLHLAAALADAGETGPAADICRALLAETPDDSEAQLCLAYALACGGDTVGALDTLRALAPVKAGQEASRAASLDKTAEALRRRSEAHATAEVLRMSMAVEPANFQHAMQLADVLEQMGESDGALVQYRGIVSALPESPKSSDRIDAIYAARGDAAGRVAEWRTLAEKHPEAASPWRRLADALEQAGDADGAAKARAQADGTAAKAGS